LSSSSRMRCPVYNLAFSLVAKLRTAQALTGTLMPGTRNQISSHAGSQTVELNLCSPSSPSAAESGS
jgi:hypothetical protein